MTNEGISVKTNTPSRQMNVELLRIVAMLMIVGNHLSVHGGLPINSGVAPVGVNYLFAQFLACGGKLGANVFVLISGYFLVKSTVHVKSLVVTWLRMVVIGLVAMGIFSVAGGQLKTVDWLRAFFPLVHNVHWFMTDYVVLLLFAPFLGGFMRSLSRRQYRMLLLTGLVVYSVLPTLLSFPGYATRRYFDYSPLVWFFYLFAVAGYVRLHMPDARGRAFWASACCVVSLAAMFGLVLACDWLVRNGHSGWRWQNFRDMNSFFVFSASVSLLVAFLGIKANLPRWIGAVAATTLGVYLLHDNYLLRSLLWRRMFRIPESYKGDAFPVESILVVAIVFAMCVIVSGALFFVMRPIERLIARSLSTLDVERRKTVDQNGDSSGTSRCAVKPQKDGA